MCRGSQVSPSWGSFRPRGPIPATHYLGFTGEIPWAQLTGPTHARPRILRRPFLSSSFLKPSLSHTILPLMLTSRSPTSLSQPVSVCKTFLITLGLPTLSPSLHLPTAPFKNCHQPLLSNPLSFLIFALCLASHIPNPVGLLPSSLLRRRRPLPSLLSPSSPLSSPPLRALVLAPIPAPSP